MDYNYGQSERQFEEENEEYEETRHQYRQEREEEIGGNQSSAGKLFVGGLSWDTTEETFSSYFSKYGEITDAVIMMDRNTGRPRGFGFITFSDPAAAERALEDEHVIDGRTVEVKRTVPKGDMEGKGIVRAKKIFIGGIPPSLTEDELKEYFSPYGSIVDHQIMLDHKTGRSRGFGFVTFESEDAVEQIFSEGKTHELSGKQVEIKKAEPKTPGGVGGGDYGSASKSYGGYNNRSSGYGASHSSGNQYGGKMGRGYDGYGNYSAYGGYGGSYASNAASFYGGYGGGYGFGYGYGGAMMYGAGGYGGSGYGNPSAYGSNATGYAGGKGYGKNGENGNFAAGKGYGYGYGYGNGVGGGYGASSNGGGGSGGGGGAGSAPGRYHPYRK